MKPRGSRSTVFTRAFKPAAQRSPQLEVLDLRHFSGAQLAPLLRDEALHWNARLQWDYTKSVNLLLEYLDGRILPGFVALYGGKVVGYAFCVYEGVKAVIGDVYAFGEGEGLANPTCETLLHHMLEMLQVTPGIDRIETQLLMFPFGALAAPFLARGFRSFPRLFMMCDLNASPLVSPHQPQPGLADFRLQPWSAECYDAVAALIHSAYTGHMDSGINDQYQTVHGAQRFLHNIIRFPGCGTFDTENSWLLRDPHSLDIVGALLTSRVRKDVGHITQLCISPKLRGRGLGLALLRHCAAEFAYHGVTGLSLTVTEANATALALYESNGFATLHRFEAMVWDAG
jgi:ribosomal protein S18 acetylase RimI-like enzyme